MTKLRKMVKRLDILLGVAESKTGFHFRLASSIAIAVCHVVSDMVLIVVENLWLFVLLLIFYVLVSKG
jgi:hypothetical protein